MACENCLALREKVDRLERELGIRTRAGEIGAIMDSLDVTGTQARMLLRLHTANGRWVGTTDFIDEGMCGSRESVRSQFTHIRKIVGDKLFESQPGPCSLGYRMLTPGHARVLAAIQPVEMQDVRG